MKNVTSLGIHKQPLVAEWGMEGLGQHVSPVPVGLKILCNILKLF